jgi:phosphoribosyl 1,2-cyclic phosphodiesterase
VDRHVRVWTLGSGSQGNAVLVECDDERILIDCGFGTRTIKQRLAIAGVDPRTISACLVTHEHSDHIAGVGRAAAKWQWPIFATVGTATAAELIELPVTTISPREKLQLVRMTIDVVPTPHDATESVGFVVTSNSTGARAAVFTDIGHVTAAVRKACADVNVLILESNHDDEMLRFGPYPLFLQNRIRSRVGHLSNPHAADLIGESVNPGLQHVVLAHLSEQCNTPRRALDTTAPVLRKTRFKGRLTAAPQDRVVGPFVPSGGSASQLTLF